MVESCLNCVFSALKIEKEDGIYGYEGDCNHWEAELPPEIWDYQEDDADNLQEAARPLLEKTAFNCDYYEQIGIGQPE